MTAGLAGRTLAIQARHLDWYLKAKSFVPAVPASGRGVCGGGAAPGRAQRRTEHFVEGHGYRVLLVREQALHVLDRVAFLLLVRGAARLQAERGPSLCGAKGVKVLIHAQRVVVLRRHVDARGAVQDLRHPRYLFAL